MTTSQRLEVHLGLGRLPLDSSPGRSRRDSNGEEKSASKHSGLAALKESLDAGHGGC